MIHRHTGTETLKRTDIAKDRDIDIYRDRETSRQADRHARIREKRQKREIVRRGQRAKRRHINRDRKTDGKATREKL